MDGSKCQIYFSKLNRNELLEVAVKMHAVGAMS